MGINTADITFASGKWGVAFDTTDGSGVETIKTKDSTSQIIFVEYMQLACGSGAEVGIFDGSDASGTRLTGKMPGSEPEDYSNAPGPIVSQIWDFRDDPIECRCISAICLSCTGDGFAQGFVKGYMGV